ncbi:hypothetical protein EXIGLDRAFT_682732 [Exidia glandulosa HHB12029]|uniref:Cupin type-1 domain-containing protein n=1 Tax=Exidia glandulosa HHB12029 TaxID=1314781 RepID=A0A165DG64_EXIGL|nr:hypothetical protein EXIGLDRAFT_682732 [Exidia glandulosa HHB12029]
MADSLKLTPASALHISRHMIAAHGLIPNTSIQSRPLLIYHSAFEPSSVTPAALEEHLHAVGAVVPQWRYTMYPTSHFHSTTHEVLAVSWGAARLCFGGDDNPAKVEPTVRKGDVIVVPAGVAHRLIKDLNEGGESFEMVGSYPPGCNWDMCYGNAGEQDVAERIAKIPWFERDPVYGDSGPVLED